MSFWNWLKKQFAAPPSETRRYVWKLTDDGRYYRRRPEAYPGEPHDPIIRHDADCIDNNCGGCA